MKTTNRLLILALVCLWLYLPFASHAQVKIGEEVLPTKGALLDLKKTTSGTDYYLGGLLLPNVEILDLGYIPPTFTDASNLGTIVSGKGVDTYALLAGTIVYNTKAVESKNIQVGVYVWDGNDWKLMSDGGSMKLEPDPGEFNKDGDSKDITIVNPGCTSPGTYTFTVIVGNNYASVDPGSSTDGKFKLTFDPNPTAMKRNAVVMVTDPCGESTNFIFVQGYDASLCDISVTVPAIKSYSSTVICAGGAAYLYLDGSIGANDPNDYIWTLGGLEVGRGTTYTATASGKYIVYYKAIGCDNNSGGLTITSSSDTAPSPVRIIVNGNNGYVCDVNDATSIIAQTNGAGTIEWFKDGVHQPTLSGLQQISAGVGTWYAVVQDGNTCWSKPSDSAVVQVDPNAGTAVTMPAISVNGETNSANFAFCAGGMAHLVVTNVDASVTRYTWYAENTVIGYGTSVYYNIPSDLPNVIIRCRAEGPNCSQEAIIMEAIGVTAAPTAPRITGLDVLCGGEVTLTANTSISNPQYIWYRGELTDTEATTVLSETGQNLTTRQVGIYQVAVKDGDCVSRKSAIKTINLSDFTTLSWVQTTNKAFYESTVLFEASATNGPVTYKWEVTNATLLNTSGNRTYVEFPDNSHAATATIKVTATNDCGSTSITQSIDLENVCAAPTIPTPSSNQTLTAVVGLPVKLPVMVQGAISPTYQWYMNTAPMNTTTDPTAATATLNWTPTSTGSYVFCCYVTNVCASGNSSVVASKIYTVDVIDNPANYTAGSGTFTGKTCFDIVYSNFGTDGCGTESSRTSQKTDFSLTTLQDPASSPSAPFTANQVYTFTTSGAVSNVRFIAVDEDGDIVESVTPQGTYTGSLTSGTACKVNVLYKSSLNTSLRGLTTEHAKVLKLYAVYTSGSTNYSVLLSINLQDCACCGANLDTGWKAFMCHNLGADDTLDPFTPVAATAARLHGDKYRFGAKNASYTMALDQSNASSISGWTSASSTAYPLQATGNWDEVNNNPCPDGWRLPTYDEWSQVIKAANGNTVRRTGSWTNSATNYTTGIYLGEGLFLPAAGYRSYSNGALNSRGSYGYYWSSSQGSPLGYYLYFNSGGVTMTNANRAYGFSVRCVSE